MRLATRTFLWSLLPFALLLGGSFWAAHSLVLSEVRGELRSTVKDTQASIVRMRSRSEQKNGEALKIVAENSALKAGVELLLEHPRDAQARGTVEDQLLEICNEVGFDFLLVSDPDGKPLAAVMRGAGDPARLNLSKVQLPRQGYVTVADRTYQAISVPIDQGSESLGILSVGEQFDLSAVPVPAVLVHYGSVVASSAGGSLPEIEAGLKQCKPGAECNLRLLNETFLSLPMDSAASADGYELRSLQSVDAATGRFEIILRSVFVVTGLGALAGVVFVSGLTSRSMVKPIMGVVEHLRQSATTGELPEFHGSNERIHEIKELTRSFNRAAAAIREAHGRLQRANIEFIESLASALDARDPYTAGHSRRVSEYSVAIATAMRLDRTEVEDVRIGALLHDVGKIGVSDTILLKPGKLTAEENALIRQHPTIGRRILEGVNGFQPYLGVVELHHENWDGSGYPHGLSGAATPLAARIVKIADAYDAMTSSRPYRQGMSHDDALAVFESVSGTQLDPSIVAVFRTLQGVVLKNAAETETESLRRLAAAVRAARPVPVAQIEGEDA